MALEFYSDGFTLHGILHLPKQPYPPVVIGSHGLEGSKESAKQVFLSRLLPGLGIAFFRFDHRGCGLSEGDFITDTSLEKRTRDYIDAVHHLRSLGLTNRKIALFGSSMGGAVCINAWKTMMNMDLDLCGAVLCAAPVNSLTIENIPTKGNGKRPALPLRFFAENLLFDLTPKLSQLTNILVFHGDQDEVVPVENAHQIYRLAKDTKKLIIHTNGNHQMSQKSHQDNFNQEAGNWFSTCLFG